MIRQDPTQTSIYVRRPAGRFFMPRSMPITPPSKKAAKMRMMMEM